jgi:hypothetical protein
MIDALMYGLIPSATIENDCNAPPEKMSRKPKIDSPLVAGSYSTNGNWI